MGETVTRADIEEYVRVERGTNSAGEVTRRIRDLRGAGWDIRTRNEESGLKANEYRLASSTKGAPPFSSEHRSITSLLTEILGRSRLDLEEIYEVLKQRLGY